MITAMKVFFMKCSFPSHSAHFCSPVAVPLISHGLVQSLGVLWWRKNGLLEGIFKRGVCCNGPVSSFWYSSLRIWSCLCGSAMVPIWRDVVC